MKIRAANRNDYIAVRDFYYAVTDEMKDAAYKPGWERDVYPAQDFLLDSIEAGELYMGELDGETVACMVVNQQYNEGYKSVRWTLDAADSEIYVIHALGVRLSHAGKGIAKELVRFVIDMARAKDIRTIRLDVLSGNVPAERAYTKMGFQHLDTLRMFYEDTGWTDFKVYEYIV